VAASPFNQRTIDEFHAKRGRGIGGWGDHLLLMTSRGARTGRQITTPLVTRPLGDGFVVIASKGGAPNDPQWYRNLQANPEVTIEVPTESGTEHLFARARFVPPGPERDRLYEFMIEVWPSFRDYQKRTTRTIPVIILERATESVEPSLGERDINPSES
jgi:deazaflavin-dependent oxidoreductase (nitroreductase family)